MCVCVQASECAYLVDRCLGSHKEFNSQQNDLSSYCTAYGWLLIIQLSVQNQVLFDVDWFLVRLHQATEHWLLTSVHDLTWLLMLINNPFKDLTKTHIFFFKSVCYRTVYGFLYVHACFLRVCPCPYCSLVYCMCSPLCSGWVVSCAGPNLGGWCVMCLGHWLRRRCDVYLCLWRLSVTAFFNWPNSHDRSPCYSKINITQTNMYMFNHTILLNLWPKPILILSIEWNIQIFLDSIVWFQPWSWHGFWISLSLVCFPLSITLIYKPLKPLCVENSRFSLSYQKTHRSIQYDTDELNGLKTTRRIFSGVV